MKTNNHKIGAKRSGILAAVAVLVVAMMVFSVLPTVSEETFGEEERFTVKGENDAGITSKDAQPIGIVPGGDSPVMTFTAKDLYGITSYTKTINGEVGDEMVLSAPEGAESKFDYDFPDADALVHVNVVQDQTGERINEVTFQFTNVTSERSVFFHSTFGTEYDVTLDYNVVGTLDGKTIAGRDSLKMKESDVLAVTFADGYVIGDVVGMSEPEMSEDGEYLFKVDKEAPNHVITALKSYVVEVKMKGISGLTHCVWGGQDTEIEEDGNVIATARSYFEVSAEEKYKLVYTGMLNIDGDLIVDPRADTHSIEAKKVVHVDTDKWVVEAVVDGEIIHTVNDDHFYILEGSEFEIVFVKYHEYSAERSRGILPGQDGKYTLDPKEPADGYAFHTQEIEMEQYTVTVVPVGDSDILAKIGGSEEKPRYGVFELFLDQYLEVTVERGFEVYTFPGIIEKIEDGETRYYVDPDYPNHVITANLLSGVPIWYDKEAVAAYTDDMEFNPGDLVYKGEILKLSIPSSYAFNLVGLEIIESDEGRGIYTVEVVGDDDCEIETVEMYEIKTEGEGYAVSHEAAVPGTVVTVSPSNNLIVLTEVSVTTDGQGAVKTSVKDGVYSFVMPESPVTVSAKTDIRTMYVALIQIPKAIEDVYVNGQTCVSTSILNIVIADNLKEGVNKVTYTMKSGDTGQAKLYYKQMFTGEYTELPGNEFDPTKLDTVLKDIVDIIGGDGDGEGLPGILAGIDEAARIVYLTLSAASDGPSPEPGPEPTPPTPVPADPSEDFDVFVNVRGDDATVAMVAKDGGYISGGEISVTYYYSVYNEDYGFWETGSETVTVNFIGSQTTSAISVIPLADEDFFSGALFLEASYGGMSSSQVKIGA